MTAAPPTTPSGARARLGLLALVLVVAPFGVLLVLVETGWDPLLDLDEAARDSLHGLALRHPAFVTAMRVVSGLGTSWVYLAVFAVLAGALLTWGSRRAALFVVVTPLTSTLVNSAVKLAVHRARPVLPDPVAVAAHFSFPSGHAQAAAVAAGTVLVVASPVLSRGARGAAGVAALGWAALVAFSRVALGVHYVSDVLAGAVLGLAWLVACAAVLLPGGGSVRRSRPLPAPRGRRPSARPPPSSAAPPP